MFGKNKKGFTLIELLVVIAIISLLVSILLPSLNKARDLARATVCMTQLRTMATAQSLYGGENDGAFTLVEDLCPWLSDSSISKLWLDYLAPYMDMEDPNEPGCLQGRIGLDHIGICPTKEYNVWGHPGNRRVPLNPIHFNPIADYTMNADLAPRRSIKNKIPTINHVYGQPVSSLPLKFEGVQNISKTMLYADSHSSNPWLTHWGNTARLEILHCGLHFRHDGAVNMAFTDGHVEKVQNNGPDPLEDVAHNDAGWLFE